MAVPAFGWALSAQCLNSAQPAAGTAVPKAPVCRGHGHAAVDPWAVVTTHVRLYRDARSWETSPLSEKNEKWDVRPLRTSGFGAQWEGVWRKKQARSASLGLGTWPGQAPSSPRLVAPTWLMGGGSPPVTNPSLCDTPLRRNLWPRELLIRLELLRSKHTMALSVTH